MAQWFNQHEPGGLPIEKAAIGVRDLSVLFTGSEWQWLVKSSSLAMTSPGAWGRTRPRRSYKPSHATSPTDAARSQRRQYSSGQVGRNALLLRC